MQPMINQTVIQALQGKVSKLPTHQVAFLNGYMLCLAQMSEKKGEDGATEAAKDSGKA